MGKLFSDYSNDAGPTTDDKLPSLDNTTNLNKTITIAELITLIFANAPTQNIVPSGVYQPFAGKVAPTDWLLCDGSAINRSTYSSLFTAITPSLGACTMTIAVPAVVTLTSHGLQTGDAVYLTTTGALPTGLTANTLYYAVRVDANTFNLSTSRANAYAGTKITTTGTQSGTHTLYDCPWGLGDGSSTFNIPDMRGRAPAGNDSMGGTVASRLTLAQTQGVYGNRGANGGEQGHQIITAELANHLHTIGVSGVAGISIPIANGGAVGATYNSGGAGSDTPHNNVQPTSVTNYIIKT